jgi:hypothetical protein
VGGEKGKGILVERRLGKRKLIELVEAKVVILVASIVEEHILASPSVPTHAEHSLEDPQDATDGGGGGAVPKRVVPGAAEEEDTSGE